MSARVGAFLWSKQREVAHSVKDHKKTAVRSCHSSRHPAHPHAGWAGFVRSGGPGRPPTRGVVL